MAQVPLVPCCIQIRMVGGMVGGGGGGGSRHLLYVEKKEKVLCREGMEKISEELSKKPTSSIDI